MLEYNWLLTALIIIIMAVSDPNCQRFVLGQAKSDS